MDEVLPDIYWLPLSQAYRGWALRPLVWQDSRTPLPRLIGIGSNTIAQWRDPGIFSECCLALARLSCLFMKKKKETSLRCPSMFAQDESSERRMMKRLNYYSDYQWAVQGHLSYYHPIFPTHLTRFMQ
jgi:hypothetical protein